MKRITLISILLICTHVSKYSWFSVVAFSPFRSPTFKSHRISSPSLSILKKHGMYPQLESALAFFYLQNELKLSSKALSNVLLKYSWVLYLRVDDNLRPTVGVLESFGFKRRHIRQMVEQVPSVLAINQEWTLPEKLISLEKMFSLHLPKYLVKVSILNLCIPYTAIMYSSLLI